jgi:ankyrin repeat protein
VRFLCLPAGWQPDPIDPGAAAKQPDSHPPRLQVVALLLSTPACDAGLADADGHTPLHWAAAAGAAPACRQLLDAGASPNVTTLDGRTPLHCVGGCLEAAQALIAAGAAADTASAIGNTPLHTAAQAGHSAVCCCLLDAGARPDMLNDAGNSPLHLAAARGAVDVIKALAGREVGWAPGKASSAFATVIGFRCPNAGPCSGTADGGD